VGEGSVFGRSSHVVSIGRRAHVLEECQWVGDFSLKLLGTVFTDGSFLHELVLLGDGVVPKAAKDWTAAICSEVCTGAAGNVKVLYMRAIVDCGLREREGPARERSFGVIGARHSPAGVQRKPRKRRNHRFGRKGTLLSPAS
jgi:hypothetical protein